MNRVAQAWNALSDEQQLAAGTALRLALGDPGWQLTLAIVRDSRPAQPEPPADPGCDDRCGRHDDLTPLWDYTGSNVLMLCPTCKQRHLNDRLRAPLRPGDVQQPFPTSMPLEDR